MMLSLGDAHRCVEKVLPLINNGLDVNHRQGAIECIYHLIHVMEDGLRSE
jgi:TATA-binding protein-associated factor